MRSVAFAFFICLVGCVLLAPARGRAQQADSSGAPGAAPIAPPLARKIPGITAPDAFPNACVSCHVNVPEQKLDARLSTLMKGWTIKVDSTLLATAQAAAPAGVTLRGKHAPVTAALRNIPAGCIRCHGADSKKAPPFARMMHLIHLTRGDENHFMTFMQGECTHCHKLNAATGVWSIPSAPEP